ncbi:hypothetical protein [uncultured Pseudokineococcus sp.]|uniref:hypothetical protein n=1 Tax=uncultured Pseudokineococcus sp. TaxID=1642928 RepID=UPI00260A1F7D|nr:hypothetical protein [uncultured Pseudokineococcus sp.]
MVSATDQEAPQTAHAPGTAAGTVTTPDRNVLDRMYGKADLAGAPTGKDDGLTERSPH